MKEGARMRMDNMPKVTVSRRIGKFQLFFEHFGCFLSILAVF
jgi:hypothetical protein